MNIIYIARHGQDEDNALDMLNGRRDTPLTVMGESQAQTLGQTIRDSGVIFDVLYSSPLRRAADTALIAGTIAN